MASVYGLDAKKVKEIELPPHFEEEIRPDLIKRAVLAIYSHKRQPYGASMEAGKQHSDWTSKRRHTWKSTYGRGISRVRRTVLWREGSLVIWKAILAPHVVGGRRAHPPKPEKIWYEKINKKERRKAIRSAIAATASTYFVISRYSKARKLIEEIINKYSLPLIIDSNIEDVQKVKDFKKFLDIFGLKPLVEMFSEKKIRAGKGKKRGRRYVKHRGILFVVSSEEEPLYKVLKSFNGIEVVPVNRLNAEVLAPGCKPGRFTVWTEASIEKLYNLFI